MEKKKMIKEQQQAKEEVKAEVQEQEKVDPLVKKEIMKMKVENFNFLPLYYFLIYDYIFRIILKVLIKIKLYNRK